MAVVGLGANGEVEVLDPGTPEEAVEAEAALLRLVEALARADAARDYAQAVADLRGGLNSAAQTTLEP
jgi:hypothetical protein